MGFLGFAVAAVVGYAIMDSHRPPPYVPPPEPPPPADTHRYHEGHRLTDLKVQSSSYGKVIPLVYGTVRIAGNVIWSHSITENQTVTTDISDGGRRIGRTLTHNTNYAYTATLAIALCKGPITGVLRIWADSTQLDLSKLNYTLYIGDEEQNPDTTIISFEGEGKTPAYRGLAYIVIRDFPLAEYHDRIPNFTFEVRRHFAHSATPPLENKITNITFGQGVGEYLYDTVVQEKAEGTYDARGGFAQRGVAQKLNQNNSNNKADSLVALDDMKTVLPKVEWVSLPVYWVLNINDGNIKPGVDFQDRNSRTTPDEWKVASYTRGTAQLVPEGLSTPSDSSILRTAQELKQRGYKVMLYPKLLYFDPEKKAFVDVSTSSFRFFAAQYHDFVTHYATLNVGGALLRNYIDAFVIASGLAVSRMASAANTITNEPTHVPVFKRLAAAVRAALPSTKLIFSAFSHWYHSAYKQYHLDDLWSDPNIDTVGIECYFPLAEGWQSGEGWDHDSEKNPLTPTFAWKNIRHWWENFHVNPDGPSSPEVGYAAASKRTSWQPKMKPIWITELAFGSVDGCTNEPEVFSVPHSKRYPKGSTGRTDFSAQRTAIDESLDYLSSQEFIEKTFVSFWDSRPYPYYPSVKDRWLQPYTWNKDASLQGKLGLMMLNSIVEDLLQEVGLSKMCDATKLDDMICGFVISKRQSVRASLEQLASAYFFDAVESNGILNFTKRGSASVAEINSRDFIAQTLDGNETADSFIITRAQELELPRSLDVIYINAAQYYETGTANAQRQTVAALNSVSINLPIVLSAQDAQRIADVTMLQMWITRTQYKFSLPPKYMWLKPTDVITVHKQVEHNAASQATQATKTGIDHVHYMRILAVKLMPNGVQEISAVAEDVSSYKYYGERNETAPRFTLPHPTPKTQLVLLDLPAINADDGAYLSCAAVAQTAGWRGAALYAAACGRDGPEMCDADCSYQGQILEQATLGTVVAFDTGFTSSSSEIVTSLRRRCATATIWDNHTTIDVVLIHGELSSATEENVLAGANLCVIGDELLQFQKAEFVRDHCYRLSKLLRGRKGTENFINTQTAGARFVLINSAIVQIPVPLACWNVPRQYKAVSLGEHLTNTDAVEFTYNARALKPYSPCHVTTKRNDNGDIIISWIRRDLINENWLNSVGDLSEKAERYEVDVMSRAAPDAAVLESPAQLASRVKRTITGLTSPSAIYTKEQEIEDFGEAQTNIELNVYQLSALMGRGYPETARRILDTPKSYG